ncbi:hypothetical protein [Collimonas sp. OK607]|uniref:hypothetical protein n=1 Tax=Collimonas sp. OK607 TaxID=1798194 RepID=UPI001113A539|nr:hypothetical protein [Collimonas sp. OK607]
MIPLTADQLAYVQPVVFEAVWQCSALSLVFGLLLAWALPHPSRFLDYLFPVLSDTYVRYLRRAYAGVRRKHDWSYWRWFMGVVGRHERIFRRRIWRLRFARLKVTCHIKKEA